MADSDDEDDIEHFDSVDCIMTNIDEKQQQINLMNHWNGGKNLSNTSIEAEAINLGNS